MRFLLFKDLAARGIPYSDRQLKRLEAAKKFPRRVPLAKGDAIKGWADVTMDRHIEKLAKLSAKLSADAE
jgi:hypothetical protein